MVEDGSALRKISEAADRSYQVAPEPSQLLLRIKSFAIDFAVFLAELSPTKDHFNSQWCSRKIGIESSHFINTTWKHFSVVRMNFGCVCLCIAPPVANNVHNGLAPWLRFTSKTLLDDINILIKAYKNYI